MVSTFCFGLAIGKPLSATSSIYSLDPCHSSVHAQFAPFLIFYFLICCFACRTGVLLPTHGGITWSVLGTFDCPFRHRPLSLQCSFSSLARPGVPVGSPASGGLLWVFRALHFEVTVSLFQFSCACLLLHADPEAPVLTAWRPGIVHACDSVWHLRPILRCVICVLVLHHGIM